VHIDEFEMLFNVLAEKCRAGKFEPDGKTVHDLINGVRYTKNQLEGRASYKTDYALTIASARRYYSKIKAKEGEGLCQDQNQQSTG